MAEARQRDEWGRTANLLCLNYNLHRDPKSTALKPSDFDPFKPRPKATPRDGVGFRILKTIFVDSLPQPSGKLIGGGNKPADTPAPHQ